MESKHDPAGYKNASFERQGDMSNSMSQRKRPAFREKDALGIGSFPNLATERVGDTFLAEKTPAEVPVEVLDTIFEFLDGNGLLSCEVVSYQWRLATDRIRLWKRACLAAFPHLGDYNFDSASACCSAYEGDWRETFLDGNRENRSVVLDWDMQAVADGNGDPEESERRYFPPFSLCGYSLSLLADPGGNPRAIIQAQAVGAPIVEKGLSVYLTVAFPGELPDAPPWSALGVDFHQPYPPPPMLLGPCHPWGEDERESGGREEDPGTDRWKVGADRANDLDHGCDSQDNTGGNNAKGRERTAEAAAVVVGAGMSAAGVVPRDPHGLRRRRRRFRQREGRVKGVSHAGDPAVITRECCAAFSLAAVNKAGHKDMMWISSMEGDRFFSGRNSWGVHCLLPMSMIQDPEEGFLKDGNLTVRLRVRLLFLIAHVYTTADLASHRGFGVVPVRGEERTFHYSGGNPSGGGKDEKIVSPPGPLSCLTFEVLRCTTLEDMESMIARALNLASTQDLRLWVITQPLTDGPLAPRQLLSGEDMSSSVDDGQDSPSLFRLLRGDTLDDTCRVRLWAEQRADAGFWEAEMIHPRWNMPITCANGTRRAAPRPASRETFAGVRLSCAADMPPWLMHSSLAWGSVGYPKDWLNAVMADVAGSAPGQAPNASALFLMNSSWMAAGGSSAGAASSAGGERSAETPPPREERILVFLKTLGLRREEGECSGDGGGNGSERPVYLTHVVLRGRSPLRSLFELVADLLRDGTAPEELGAYVEDLPCAWQGGAAGKPSHIPSELPGGATPERCCCSKSERNRSSKDDFCCSGKGATRAGRSKGLKTTPSKRFFLCAPPQKMALSQHPFTPWTAELGVESNVDLAGRGGSGGGMRNATAVAVSAKDSARTVSAEGGRRQVNELLTLESAGVTSGASICFFRIGRDGTEEEGEAMVRSTYAATANELVKDMRKLLRGEGPLGRVHLIKLLEVVEMCESLGYQGFRVRIAHDQQRHVNARETLEYVARGRHLAFICDSCGTQDFMGPRYHCLRCPDYDLCRHCHDREEPAPPHRYLFIDGHWKREGRFYEHTDDHDLEEIWPMPAEGCNWRRQHYRQMVP